MRKRIPKGRVQRKVFLDHEMLRWALNVLKDDRFNVEQRGEMTPVLRAKYTATEHHLHELIAAAERA